MESFKWILVGIILSLVPKDGVGVPYRGLGKIISATYDNLYYLHQKGVPLLGVP